MLNASDPAGPVFRYVAVFFLIALKTAEALAQTSGSISLVSDYRFRGRSLSNGHAATQIGLAYDSPRGWYAGGLASSVESYWQGSDAQLLVYGGYAERLTSGLHWEAGAVRSTYAQSGGYDYTEIYAGIGSRNLGTRIYFSPDAFGRGSRTLYAELNGAFPFDDHFSLIGHLGALRAAPVPYGGAPIQRDTRIGISAKVLEWTFQMERVAVRGGQGADAYYAGRSAQQLVFAASYAF